MNAVIQKDACLQVMSKINVITLSIQNKIERITKITTSCDEIDEKSQSIDNTVLSEFECPICTEYMQAPILMCAEGHSICKSCMLLISKCPICLRSKSSKRNYSLENLRQKLVFPCKYKSDCKFVTIGSKLVEHEKNCPHRKLHCAFKDVNKCSWEGSKLKFFEHCQTEHKEFTTDFEENQMFLITPIDENFISSNKLYVIKFNDEIICYGLSFAVPSYYLNWYIYYIGNSKEAMNYSYEIEFKKGNQHVNLKANLHQMDEGRSIFKQKHYLSCHYFQLLPFLENGDIRHSLIFTSNDSSRRNGGSEDVEKVETSGIRQYLRKCEIL